MKLSALAASASGTDRDDLADLTPAQQVAVLTIEALLGHKMRPFRSHSGAASSPGSSTHTSGAAASATVVHQRTELHAEAERTSFAAQGSVQTADGRSISFSAQLTMQRQFQSKTVTTTADNATQDPLIVNFGGGAAQLTNAKIAFDLNGDGKPETVSFVAGGSGFLVLDRNADGQVNDGTEMFGPQSGNGFAELAAYDSDGNGWIDENDPVFTQFRVWSQDGLASLSDKGIGAIATSSVATPFAIKDSSNALEGNVVSSGVYLSENGLAGTVQQVDLAVG